MPLTVGTEQIQSLETSLGRRHVYLLEPPVDVFSNSRLADIGVDEFRTHWELNDDVLNVVCVSRLAHELKLEGIVSALEAVDNLSRDRRVRLIIAGGGPAMDRVASRANAINEATGRRTVVLTGELRDPRPAYAVADVVLGMGGSALRGLSFAKPLIVQGERGFWRLLTPESLPTFLWQGWYGWGTCSSDGQDALTSILAPLLEDADARSRLGRFGRQVVEDRFSLADTARRQLAFYDRFVTSRPSFRRSLTAEAAALARFSAHQVQRRYHSYFGNSPRDDFNAKPVAASPDAASLRPNGRRA
ncbi:glycosyltransferase [Arthrobacter sp. StoSoilA2]|uniref:glycosyltransferase n=1 Tax=Arthrobacter sp. StoSoilA2 TaxID=2830990 RepID=UPI001CC63F00|nr:glycosyltransferase [Arthrobacter sp. StoSoilA2]